MERDCIRYALRVLVVHGNIAAKAEIRREPRWLILAATSGRTWNEVLGELCEEYVG